MNSLRVASDALLLSSRQVLALRIGGPEAELAIEPESSGVDRLGIVVPNLIGIDRDRAASAELSEEAQELGEEPGRLAFAEGVVDVEAQLEAVAERQALDIGERDAILEQQGGEVGVGQVQAEQQDTPTQSDPDAEDAVEDVEERPAGKER